MATTITTGSVYLLDDNLYRCLSFNGSLGWFQLLNVDGTDHKRCEYNSFGELIREDRGKRIIYQRISELLEVPSPGRCSGLRSGQLSLIF